MANVEKVEKKRRKLKKGFTLIELLIVVVVIATLMGLVFRLAGVGGDEKARNITVTRIQKLEFALSGYYAAFGSYPPVPLHGTRNIYCSVNNCGVQGDGSKDSTKDLVWSRVQAACLSQPIAVEFPFCNNHANQELMKTRQEMITLEQRERQRKGKPSLSSSVLNWKGDILGNPSILNPVLNSQKGEKPTWQKVQVFKFGVLSFLLPRYLFMLEGDERLYDGANPGALQWQSQNDISSVFDFRTGRPAFTSWDDLKDKAKIGGTDTSNNKDLRDYLLVVNQPSQAVCARWMHALDGIILGGRMFFGVDTSEDHDNDAAFSMSGTGTSIFSPNKNSNNDSTSSLYMLDRMTVRDGWHNDLYYYSPPPYQGCRVWSGGKDGKTIPPWVDTSRLEKKQREIAADWLADDIVHLSGNSK